MNHGKVNLQFSFAVTMSHIRCPNKLFLMRVLLQFAGYERGQELDFPQTFGFEMSRGIREGECLLSTVNLNGKKQQGT